MEKKLIAQGPNDRKSYTITLPIEWVKEEKLDKKKTVELDIIGNKILLSAYKHQGKAEIDCKTYNKTLIKVLQGMYRAGINEVRFNSVSAEKINYIADICERKLIGFEIVEQKKDYLIIRDIAQESNEEFKTIFRRIFLLIIELSESDNIPQAEALVRPIKKFINYCQRVLIKRGHTEFNKTTFYYIILDRLEKFTDEMDWFLHSIQGKKPEEITEINSIFRDAYDLFYSFDPKKYDASAQRAYELKNEIRIKNKVDISTMHLHNLARYLNSLYGDIFSLKFTEIEE
jgi:hypothetical protein